SCHPFFSGRQKFVDTAGRVERFQKRFAKTSGETAAKAPAAQSKMAKGQKAAPSKKVLKVLRSTPIVIPVKPGGKPGAGKPAAKAGGKAAPGKPTASKAH